MIDVLLLFLGLMYNGGTLVKLRPFSQLLKAVLGTARNVVEAGSVKSLNSN